MKTTLDDKTNEGLRVYISGPVSGLNFGEVKSRFNEAEEHLVNIDCQPINPILFGDERKEWKEYLKDDIRKLLDCDAILMLHGSENSKGCMLELYIARHLDILVEYEID